MICRRFAEHVDELIDGVLAPEAAKALNVHVATCAACAAELTRAERFRDLLAGSGRVAVAAAADREASLRARAEVARMAPRAGTLRRFPLPLAAAALLLVGFGAGTLLPRPRPAAEPAVPTATPVATDTTAADLQARLDAKIAEVAGLRAEIAQREVAIAALKAEANAAAVAAAPAREIPWAELGANARKLLGLRELDSEYVEAMAPFLNYSKELSEATGRDNPFLWPLDPVVLARSAAGFVDALAPEASPESRAAATAAMQTSADGFARLQETTQLPSEVLMGRLRMLRSIVETIHEHLGDGPAAELARGLTLGADGTSVLMASAEGPAREESVLTWVRQLDLTDGQRDEVRILSDRRIAATLEVQERIAQRMSQDNHRALYYTAAGPVSRGRNTSRDSASEVAANAQTLPATLARLDAKLELLEPRLEFDRALRVILTPEQLARSMRLRATLQTYRR